ncbi:SecY-interacting protein [Shewanella surugensis]|uniref:Protein Syd n=1 Tax=Shewanella surugensis TaxID=212020 RepID=A0ABT0L9X3_9GAMM|nr:SecY-interacting protein [Shewanella surugensis]MCL1124359.1 SecY-interacting protein [Shewanella surugensis]
MSSLPALTNFFNAYHQAYQEQLNECPRFFAKGEHSDCILDEVNLTQDEPVQWVSVIRDEAGNFDNLNQALKISLHTDIDALYGHYFSGPLMFDSSWGQGEILQVWNQNDFECLQQNIIGHLMMKKKLKQPLTWFIGVFDENDTMITVNNDDGSVWIEKPGEVQSTCLADSLNDFISQLTPRVSPAKTYHELEEAMEGAADHPGIWQRFKSMYQHLRESLRGR